jgi:hypothetical protein
MVCGFPAVLRGQSNGQKLNIAFIGCGGHGAENITALASENVVALCDVNANNLNAAAQQFPSAKTYRDFRKMLEQKDIEAVVISTPDHTHAVAALAAIRSGRHVYCETPLTHTVSEARLIAQAAREHKVATQMGNLVHSADGTRVAVEWIQAGIIGPVGEVFCWTDRPTWPQGLSRPADTPPVPPHLDWDLWLGPAPERPYHPNYQPVNWRAWWDFGTGALGDMGCSVMDAPFWALNLGSPSLIEAESAGMTPESAPKASIVRYQFPVRGTLPAVRLHWYDGGKPMPSETADLATGVKNGALFAGSKGHIILPLGGMPRLIPQPSDFKSPQPTLPRSVNHHQEWLQACKGGKPAEANFDYAGPLTELVLLGSVALRTGKRLEWDATSLSAPNVPEAGAFLSGTYRKGWTL